MNESVRKRTKFLKVVPYIYRHYQVLPDGSKGEGVGAYYLYLWHKGEQIKESLCDDLVEAKLKAKKRRMELDREDPHQRGLSLEEACERYFNSRVALSASSQSLDKRIRERIYTTFPRGIKNPIRTYKLHEIEQWVAKLPKYKSTGEPAEGSISASLKNKIVLAVKNIFERAKIDGARSDNPASTIRYIPRPEPKRITPSWGEFMRIVAEIRTAKSSDTGKDSADWVEFSGRAGLGRAEINALTWGDIDFERGTMWVLRKKTKTNYQYLLHALVIPFLKDLRERCDPLPTTPIFKIGVPKGSFANACRRLGLPIYEPRALRRLHISTCVEQLVPVEVIASNQGHKDGGRLVRQVYFTLRPLFAREQLAKLVEPGI